MHTLLVLFICATTVALGGCAVVKAGADVAGAAGRLGGAIVSETAGAIGSAASSGSRSPQSSNTCNDGDKDCKPDHQ